MLEFIRRHSQSIIVKAFLIILALTFVLFFGISDVIRRFTGKDYVAKIGSAKIDTMKLKIEKTKRIGMLRDRGQDINGKDLTFAVLHQLIWENIVDQAAHEYGIVISDETIKNYISGMNMFRNKDGSFNANLLHGFLQRIQVQKPCFLNLLKRISKTH